MNYVGSITIDSELMKAAEILPGEKVQIANINTGDRVETHTMEGAADSGIVCLNGAAARLTHTGDKIIIIACCWLEAEAAKSHQPTIVLMDEGNRIST